MLHDDRWHKHAHDSHINVALHGECFTMTGGIIINHYNSHYTKTEYIPLYSKSHHIAIVVIKLIGKPQQTRSSNDATAWSPQCLALLLE